MNELTAMKENLVAAVEMIEKYEAKATKAESKRIRVTLGEIKKGVTPCRAALVAADKS